MIVGEKNVKKRYPDEGGQTANWKNTKISQQTITLTAGFDSGATTAYLLHAACPPALRRVPIRMP